MLLDVIRAAALAALLLLPTAAALWGPWSACRRCQQSRRQLCPRGSPDCDGPLWLEVRACPGSRCPQPRLRARSARPPGSERNFRVLHHLQSLVYSNWSGWSPCSSDCRTHRQRQCKMPLVCGKAVLHEDALCYVRGSPCEARFASGGSGGSSEEDTDSDRGFHLDPPSCGVPRSPQRPALRIIGGQPAARGRWPWQVALLNRRREPFCGGTLVAPGWVLTAAHCLRRRLLVLAGEYSLGRPEGSEVTVRVAEAIAHPDYDPETVDMDLALLRLRSALKLGPYVMPACLPEQGDTPPPGSLATILGWGKLSKRHANGSDLLHQAQVPLVPASECRAVYADYLISHNMLCAGFRRGRVDSCAGDSGGPLLARDGRGRWTIYGVTSFGEGCARQGRFGIYAKVANAARWLRRIMAGSRP
ncbi:serine protease 33-like isoform X1 [Amblyomma americanum]